MSITFSLTDTGVASLFLTLKKGDYTIPLLGVSRDFSALVAEQFLNEQDPQGIDWVELSERRSREKSRKGLPLDILVATGESLRSFVGEVESGRRLVFGSDRVFSGSESIFTHQVGDPKTHLPARPILPLADPLPERWGDAIVRNFFPYLESL